MTAENERRDYASVLVFDEARERVLLVCNGREEDASWSLPGGRVEPGETLWQAAVRETKEETGLTVNIERLYSVREMTVLADRIHALLFTFVATVADGELRHTLDPDAEIAEARWLPVAQANAMLTYMPDELRLHPGSIDMPAFYYDHGVWQTFSREKGTP